MSSIPRSARLAPLPFFATAAPLASKPVCVANAAGDPVMTTRLVDSLGRVLTDATGRLLPQYRGKH